MTINSEIIYSGNGTQKLYTFPFEYLERSDVKVAIKTPPATAYVDKVLGTDYTFANESTIEFVTAPAAGTSNIRIYRTTDADEKYSTYYPNTPIRSGDLNKSFDQFLYLFQETNRDLVDAFNGSILAGSVGTSQLADNAVTTAKINNAAVTSGKLASSISIANLTVTGTTSIAGIPTFTGTGAVVLPASTTANRPTPATGMIRFNTSINRFEGYDGSGWTTVGGGATGGGSDEVFIENGQTVTTDYTLTANKNAVSAGPVTINSGINVTVPSGAAWVIV